MGVEPAALPQSATPSFSDSSPLNTTLSNTIQWSQALPSIALAGIVSAVVMVIPLGAFGLGVLSAGALAVFLYRRRNPGVDLTPGSGARLGMATGALGFGVFTILMALEMLVSGAGSELRTGLLDAIQQSAARSADPQAQQVVEWMKTPSGLIFLLAFCLAVMFVVFLAISALGGALGAALLRRKPRSQL